MYATRSGRRRCWRPPVEAAHQVAVCGYPTGEGVHDSVAESLKHAAEILADEGYAVEEPKLPSVMEAHEVWDLICQGELKEFFADTVSELADAPMKQAMRYMMTRIRKFTLKEYLNLYTRRATIVREWSELLEKYPVLLAPVSTRPQFVHGEDILSQEANDKSYRDQATLTGFALIGIPGVAVPTGVTDGLPTGVLVMSQRFREDVAIDAAEIIEANCPMPTPIDPRF